MARILIIGGHGKVAMLAHPLLSQAGHEVFAVIRNPSHAQDVAAAGATPVVADVEKQDLTALVRQYHPDVVVWSAGAGGGNPARTYAVDRDAAMACMDAAEDAGVRRFIMVSYMGAGLAHGVDPQHPFFPYAEAKAAADEHLRRSQLDWTLLGPGQLTDTPASGMWVGVNATDRLTSRELVAQVIAEVVENDSTIGKAIAFRDGDHPIAAAVGAAPAGTQLL